MTNLPSRTFEKKEDKPPLLNPENQGNVPSGNIAFQL